MKKVLFYTHSLSRGGAERVLVNITKTLSAEYEVVLLTDVIDPIEYECPTSVRRIVIGECGTAKRLFAIRKSIIDENPDEVVAFMLAPAKRAIVATKFTKYKVIAAVRSNPFDDYKTDKERQDINHVLESAKTIVCQTKGQIDFFNAHNQKKCEVIINPISENFRSVDRVVKSQDRKKNIVTVGRLFDYKNHKLLIRAFSKIIAEYPDYRLIIYGEGPYREELEKELKELKVEDRVLMPGELDDVAGEIVDAGLFVLPSDTEGMPNALMEAMALGVPCIATDCPCGGPASLIENGINGYLVEVNDVEAMANRIREVLDNPNLQDMFSENSKKINDIASLEEISKKWSNVIDGR